MNLKKKKNVVIDICSLFLGIEEEQLLQIQKQYKLITPGSSVLDLGCAPGAWLQVFSIVTLFFSLCSSGFMI